MHFVYFGALLARPRLVVTDRGVSIMVERKVA
jgi:hypothetical protein